MTGPHWPMDGLVAAVLLVAIVSDLRGMRIANVLTLPLWAIGPIYWTVAGPWWFGWLGLAVGFPLHFGLWALGVDKGGDAKLLIGVGACMGWSVLVEATLWSFVAMFPVLLLTLAATQGLRATWKAVAWPVQALIAVTGGAPVPALEVSGWVPKAPGIALGVLVARLVPLLG